MGLCNHIVVHSRASGPHLQSVQDWLSSQETRLRRLDNAVTALLFMESVVLWSLDFDVPPALAFHSPRRKFGMLYKATAYVYAIQEHTFTDIPWFRRIFHSIHICLNADKTGACHFFFFFPIFFLRGNRPSLLMAYFEPFQSNGRSPL